MTGKLSNTTPRKRRLICIDDDTDICEQYQEIFTDEGYEVRTAENSTDFGCQIADFKPDLVTFDLKMPGLNGETIIKLLRRTKNLENCAFLVISGFVDKDVQAYLKSEKIPFLEKPAPIESLMQIVKDLIEEKESLTKKLLLEFKAQSKAS